MLYMKNLPIEDGKYLLKEGINLEFKSGLKGVPDSFYDTYSSFANTFGGRIVLGIRDGTNEIEGVNNPEQRVQDIWNALNNVQVVNENILLPEDIWTFESPFGTLIIVDVPRADRYLRPIYHRRLETGTFKRNGEGDFRCRMTEIAAMLRDKSDITYDSTILEDMDYSDIDLDTLHSFRNFMSVHNPGHGWNAADDQVFAEKMGITARKGGKVYLTVAGLVMFGKEYRIYREFPRYKLDYREYGDGGTEWTFRLVTGDGQWEGNVFNYYIRVSNRITSELDTPLEIGKDMVRIEDTDSHKAIRELLLNALIHADYRGNLTVYAERRKNRIIISNSGLFRIPLTEAENGGNSDPRNVLIAKMFSMIGLVERAGVGVNYVMRIWERDHNVQPRIIEDTEHDSVTAELPIGVREKVNTRESKIIELMASNPKITAAEMSRIIGVSVPTISNTIKAMTSRGLIVRKGGPKGKWVVVADYPTYGEQKVDFAN